MASDVYIVFLCACVKLIVCYGCDKLNKIFLTLAFKIRFNFHSKQLGPVVQLCLNWQGRLGRQGPSRWRCKLTTYSQWAKLNLSQWGKQWGHNELTWWAHWRPTHSDFTAAAVLPLHGEFTGTISQIAHSKVTVWVANVWKAHCKLTVWVILWVHCESSKWAFREFQCEFPVS